MNIAIIVALITALASVILGCINFIAARKTYKNNRTTAMELERLKYDIEEERRVKLFRYEQNTKQLNSLDVLIASLQEMKDALYLIINSLENTYSVKAALINVKKGAESIMKAYQTEFVNLDEKIRETAHDAKNKVGSIEFKLLTIWGEMKFVSLSEKQKEELVSWREYLTERQLALRDAKDKLVMKYIV